jgi:hypothetical protein
VLEQAWRALKESRDFETAAAFVGLAFQPALVCTPALSHEPDAPLRQYCRGVRHVGKLFRGPAGLLARQLRRVWEQHPQVSALRHTHEHTRTHTTYTTHTTHTTHTAHDTRHTTRHTLIEGLRVARRR